MSDVRQLRGFITWLRLRRLLLSDPLEVLGQSQAAMKLADIRLHPRLLALAGTALRKIGDIQGAIVVLQTSRERAQAIDDYWALGDAVRRQAHTQLDRGDLEAALRMSREAIGIFTLAGDSIGVGETLITQGGFLLHLDEPRAARICFRRALKKLPENEVDFRVAALSNLARIALAEGEAERAVVLADAACRMDLPVGLWIDCVRVRALIRIDTGHIRDAIVDLESCQDFYLKGGQFLEAAFATLWLCRCLLELGRGQQCSEVAVGAAKLIGHLQGHKIASTAMVCLANAALAGKGMTLAQVDSLLHQMTEAAPGKWAPLGK